MHGEKVTVIVGESDKKTFLVSRDLITKKAPWFVSALNGQFKESNGVIELPEDKLKPFAAFLYWLHVDGLNFEDLEDITSTPTDLLLKDCISIWVFGDKYRAGSLQNAAMQRICEILIHREPRAQKQSACSEASTSQTSPATTGDSRHEIALDTSTQCFAFTRANSPLRVLAADYLVNEIECKKVPGSKFDIIAGPGHSFSEIYKAFRHYHDVQKAENGGEYFPRYHKPLKYKHLYLVDFEGAENYTFHDSGKALPACTDCGIWGVNDTVVLCSECSE
jgi:hypothetical protein